MTTRLSLSLTDLKWDGSFGKCSFRHWQTSTLNKSLSPDVVLSLTVVSDVLCVTVIQGGNDWGVTYTSTEICALKGSTVYLHCSYKYPYSINNRDTTVMETFWVTRYTSVDLRTVSQYSGRVQYNCSKNNCTLRITDLRESDSAEYRFRFITNQPDGNYIGSPGVTLSVTGNIFIHMLIISRCLTSREQ